MDHFNYKQGILHAEDVSTEAIAKAVGTPFYVYSSATLKRHYDVFCEGLSSLDYQVCFAVKANSNCAVLATLGAQGAGADVVSEGEIRRALKANISPDKIVFSGVGKTREEMGFALDQNIFQFNIESAPELSALNEVAMSKNLRAPIAIRINPDVDAGTHHKISTGQKDNKFGVSTDSARQLYATAGGMEGIHVQGVSMHIGSQLITLDPFKAAYTHAKEVVQALRADGHAIHVLDLGGGLGVPYDSGLNPPTPKEYGKMVKQTVGDLECKLVFEPGRLIVGNAGILVTKIIYVKYGDARRFYIVDAAMNDLMRPAIYDAYHDMIPVQETKGELSETDVVGPVCETGDTFAKDRKLPDMQAGDMMAFRTAGAYGAVMANTYNTRLLVPEVLVSEDQFAVIRKRPDYDALIGLDEIPDWVA